MGSARRVRRKITGKRVFFLLFAVLCTGLLCTAVLGISPFKLIFESGKAGADLPIVQWQGLNLVINLKAKSMTWQRQGSVLELKFFHAATAALPSDSDRLDDKISFSKEARDLTLRIAVGDLPQKYYFVTTSQGYIVRWLEPGLAGKRIAIDPGHGGQDPGATGRHFGLLEKTVNLDVALALKQLLENAGAEVFMTRSTDTRVDASSHKADLYKRRDIVREYSPDLFISIHNNSWRTNDAYGIETYYNPSFINSWQSICAAQHVQSSLIKAFPDRHNRGVKTKRDIVLQVEEPAVLAELLFISNREEEALLMHPDFPAKAAAALFSGIDEYFQDPGGG